jgi:FlaA1/EpsC-like NDP-sugar epimerase
MRAVFARCRPQVVFHAAAHKHVPLMEDNASAAVKNNVLGTQCIADRADECGVERFVLISTDKAVHPASVMGVSKYLAERYVEALAQRSATRFTAVRFGNVLGAAGSVVPIFQEQIRSGGPITVTDPRMARYFMTIPESAQLVLQAAALGRGGEVFVLDMGAPVRIVDLARDLIRLSGLPDHAVEIAYSGIRPGEKLFEELCCDDEHTLPTAHPRVRQVRQRPLGLDAVRASFEQLAALLDGPEEALRQRLHELVPDFPAVPWGERTAMPAAEGLLATPSG